MDRLTLYEKNVLHTARTKISANLQYFDMQIPYSSFEHCAKMIYQLINHIDRVKALAEEAVRGDDTKTKWIEQANDARKAAIELAGRMGNWGKEDDMPAVLGVYNQAAFSILLAPGAVFIKDADRDKRSSH